LYSNDTASKEKSIEALTKEYGKFLLERDLTEENKIPPSDQDKKKVVDQSVELFNEQRYWECHEAMEQIWRRETSPQEKAVQQGVILSASALVHAQKDEDTICIGMIPRALAKLDQWDEETYYTLNVGTLRRSMEEILKTRMISFPKI
ncbi:MAG: DUF309 domain-containing protein, partial [Thaumarchaeota archaeon]|nr:DUF309 domain-containing protein [Nitrososphaerota archaeon]